MVVWQLRWELKRALGLSECAKSIEKSIGRSQMLSTLRELFSTSCGAEKKEEGEKKDTVVLYA